MARKLSFGLSLALLIITGLAACGGQGSETATTGPVVIASAMPSPSPTEGVASATATPAASIVPSTAPATASPTPVPPTVTAEVTPTPVPATAIPLPLPSPSATATPETLTDLTTIRLELQLVADGLDTPVGIANAGDGSGRLFILEKVGRIRVWQDGELLAAPLLDITDRVGSAENEQGLLGLAFHPGYARNGLFYVNYTDRQGDTVISRFSMPSGWDTASPPVAEPGSEMTLLTLDQPAANHNGGHLAFGPDGYLYIGTGDGGGAGDRYGNGQNGATLLGAMLRLDVDSGAPYAVPPDNPFVGNASVRDEIWALGMRNPWRYAFDRLTGDLYIADVGQNVYEEVDLQPASQGGGQNYGWPIMEASHCFPADSQCDQTGLTLPLIEYDHTQGCSVTGGYVYRGEDFPGFQGVYVFGDYCSGRIWGVRGQAAGDPQVIQLARADVQLSSFGEDERGELYLLDMGNGRLFKLVVQPR
ncbi:MAG: PQQ-dependent sugar dehydrogenase [Anaerolineae bacterium]